MAMDLSRVLPYGDAPNDGTVQISFTLPVPAGEKARQTALVLAGKMGLEDSRVILIQEIDPNFTYFILYGRTREAVDYIAVQTQEVEYRIMDPKEINDFIRSIFGRKITVLGACIGSDAHTVGIDAIMNMKGYDMHKGLESYPEIHAINMGAQVACEDLLATAMMENADALLISQVVTQKDVHVRNLTRLIEILEAEGLREKMVVIVGGPCVTPELAKELGYDAGFGRGTYPEQVAAFLVQELVKRKKEE